MKRFFYVFLTLLAFTSSKAYAFNIDAFMDEKIAPVSDKIASWVFFPINVFGSDIPIIVLWILFAGIFFTFYLRGIAVWGFGHALHILC